MSKYGRRWEAIRETERPAETAAMRRRRVLVLEIRGIAERLGVHPTGEVWTSYGHIPYGEEGLARDIESAQILLRALAETLTKGKER